MVKISSGKNGVISNLISHFRDFWLLVRYGISGLTGATLNVFIFWFLEREGMWYPIAAVISFVIALVVNFALQKYWTFRHRHWGEGRREFMWYSTVAIVGLGMNLLLLHVFIDRLDYTPLISQVFAVLIVGVVNFLVNKIHTFRHAHTYFDTNGK